MKTYKFTFRPYQRHFHHPLHTSYGKWDIRYGVILRLIDDMGKIGWGEIAPISWFGSETLEQALDFCHQLPEKITDEMIFSIPNNLPACQFGFESALWGVGNGEVIVNSSPAVQSALLPAGEAALAIWQKLYEDGYRTFKWKIGVYPTPQELEIFQSLIQVLPVEVKLRLDANGGLNYQDANLWFTNCDNLPEKKQFNPQIEYIEQPLPPSEFAKMLELSNVYQTPIALDESVATLNQLTTTYAQGWREIFVIKPGIAGSPSRLREFCLAHKIDAVFSSVFETFIGRQAALQLAAALSHNKRALGFGIDGLFTEVEENPDILWNKLLPIA